MFVFVGSFPGRVEEKMFGTAGGDVQEENP